MEQSSSDEERGEIISIETYTKLATSDAYIHNGEIVYNRELIDICLRSGSGYRQI